MITFSANLGFLWRELSLPDAIRAAKRSGFDAVEFHDPFRFAVEEVKAALAETGLPLLSLNTIRGDVAAGDNGLAALPGREDEARAAIRQAVDYAAAAGAGKVHVMAGRANGPAAEAAYLANLAYACDRAAQHGITILIEPLNGFDAPDYFLKTTGQAVAVIERLGRANLQLMFDCYHVQIIEGDVRRRFEALRPLVGHVQIAAVPDRAEPDHGELDYGYVLKRLADLGHDQPVGAEYRPAGSVEAGLGWLAKFRALA